MSATDQTCRNPDCEVASTGKCHLGNDPVEQCPNYGHDEVATDAEGEPSPQDSPPSAIEICSGDVMRLTDLSAFIREKAVRTVALIGEQGAGKTTLLASVYAMYCRGPFAGLSFAGSRTLVGFAKRHHLALLNSGRLTPTTPRTSRDDPVSFFHLMLASGTSAPIHLIVSDRSGEAYEHARTDTELIQSLHELPIAERVCFILDGAKLASKDKRAAYTRQFKQMIHAFRDNGALANAKAVEILTTKLDLTTKDQIKFLGEYEQAVSAEFDEHGLHVTAHRVCALPKTDTSVGCVGLDEMITRWTAPTTIPDLLPQPLADASRQIDRLLSRTT